MKQVINFRMATLVVWACLLAPMGAWAQINNSDNPDVNWCKPIDILSGYATAVSAIAERNSDFADRAAVLLGSIGLDDSQAGQLKNLPASLQTAMAFYQNPTGKTKFPDAVKIVEGIISKGGDLSELQALLRAAMESDEFGDIKPELSFIFLLGSPSEYPSCWSEASSKMPTDNQLHEAGWIKKGTTGTTEDMATYRLRLGVDGWFSWNIQSRMKNVKFHGVAGRLTWIPKVNGPMYLYTGGGMGWVRGNPDRDISVHSPSKDRRGFLWSIGIGARGFFLTEEKFSFGLGIEIDGFAGDSFAGAKSSLTMIFRIGDHAEITLAPAGNFLRMYVPAGISEDNTPVKWGNIFAIGFNAGFGWTF